ncbi:hypothetical protein [uncultured Cellulomonas sp.]|uniref:hypothetical protein n=1 Tax=uncultured Cellulomonas sp. TaxID=189682 RepID=UPI0026372FF6|nr:hypothetical protein [uncultured Cellulomonas sp.]
MATFSSVHRQHVLQAIAEHDARGAGEFLDVYGFTPSPEYALLHDDRSYDATAILGVAHRYATGRLATPDEFGAGPAATVALLRRRGFEVTEPAAARVARPPAARTRTAAARTATPRRAAPATVERPVAICPTCSMTLPATGVCDTCG